MDILAILGSPREGGNSDRLAMEFVAGARASGATIELLPVRELKLEMCRGCLRCNMLGYCAQRKDDWPRAHKMISEAKGILFASPIYFHHFPGSFKIFLDRFRCFARIAVSSDKLTYTPLLPDKKRLAFILSLGAPTADDASPVIDLATFMQKILGTESELLGTICATKTIVKGQIAMSIENLRTLLPKLGLPEFEAEDIHRHFQYLLKDAFDLGSLMATAIRKDSHA